jgi:hypothetical protein|tara:strand:- start:29 stop:172 length:144 start_codon:yes stop_codon:yes gene_type:complete
MKEKEEEEESEESTTEKTCELNCALKKYSIKQHITIATIASTTTTIQ